MKAVAHSDKQRKKMREKGETMGRWMWSQKISHCVRDRLTTVPEILAHSKEEVNEIDLNVFSRDVPAVVIYILRVQDTFNA